MADLLDDRFVKPPFAVPICLIICRFGIVAYPIFYSFFFFVFMRVTHLGM